MSTMLLASALWTFAGVSEAAVGAAHRASPSNRDPMDKIFERLSDQIQDERNLLGGSRVLKLSSGSREDANAIGSESPEPSVYGTANLLGESGFEAGSPSQFWWQSPDTGSIRGGIGRTLIREDPDSYAGNYSVDLCRSSDGLEAMDNCYEGVLQPFHATYWTTGVSMSLWVKATSEEFGGCFDRLLFGVTDWAGKMLDSGTAVICVDGSADWTHFTFPVSTPFANYPGLGLFAFALAVTDDAFPTRLFLDDFSLNVTTFSQTAPGAPSPVFAVAQDSSAYVGWERAYNQGSSPVTSYEVTSIPPTTTQTVTDHRGVLMTGLTNGTSYTFRVRAGNDAAGLGPVSTTNAVFPSPSLPAGPFIPISPTRILDTRPGQPADDGIEGAITAGSSFDVQITGKGGVPVTSTAVSAAVLNVTVTEPATSGFLRVYPKGVAEPLASNLNFSPGQTVPNQVQVAVGHEGKVRIYNGSSGTVHVLADIQGYVASSLSGTAGLYNALSPARILDTRNGTGAPAAAIPANSSINLQVTGAGNVPTSSVDAVIMNATVTQPQGGGFLTIYPTGGSQPLVSNVNFVGGQTVPNRLHVPVSDSGQVTIFNGSPGTVHVIADVNGWFTDGSDAGATGGLFKGLTPSRIADSRILSGAPYSGMTLMGGDTLKVKVAGQGGVPAMGDPTPPSAVVANVTIVSPTHPGFLTAFPSDVPTPLISDLNWTPGDVRPNLAVIKIGPDGTIKLFNGSSGYLDVIVDVVGWYS